MGKSTVGSLCVLMFLFSGTWFAGQNCVAQENGSQSSDAANSQTQTRPAAPEPQSTSELPQAPAPQTDNGQNSEPEKNPLTKVETSLQAQVNKAVDLPAHWFLGAYVPSSRHLQPLTTDERGDVYVRQTYLTGASYLKRLFAAGIDQARGVPYQWGGGFGGYGQRFASRYGQFIVQNSLTSVGDLALHYEPRYDLCKCTGFRARTKHAIARNFITYDQTEERTHPQIPLYLASFAGGVIATTWKPDNQSYWRNGLYATVGQAGYGAISIWLQEFALDIGHKLSRKKTRQ